MAIVSKSFFCHSARFFSALTAVAILSACGVPGFVEGIAYGSDFTIRDDRPDLRPQHDDAALVVLAEQEWDSLRVVSLSVPAFSDLSDEQEIAIGTRDEGGAWVEVAQGPIEESVRSDGVKVLNTLTPRFVNGAGGSVLLTKVDAELFGTLEVELEDGGWLRGSFAVEIAD